jgi:hypothetical protein
MKIWSLSTEKSGQWDSVDGLVIAAPDEASARALAQEYGKDELREMSWLDPADAACVELRGEDFPEATVILWSFNAG